MRNKETFVRFARNLIVDSYVEMMTHDSFLETSRISWKDDNFCEVNDDNSIDFVSDSERFDYILLHSLMILGMDFIVMILFLLHG